MPRSGGLRVAVVGATGVVGSSILRILRERDFPVASVEAFASARSAGRLIDFGPELLTVRALEPNALGGFDVALFSAGSATSLEWAPRFVEAGAVVIDNSSAWRMDPKVPLVVPEANPTDIDRHSGIVANPNCSTIQMVVALKPIYDAAGIERVVVSTYQAVSGTGRAAVDELLDQSRAVLDGRDFEPTVYPRRIAFNALPQVETFKDADRYTTEERKMGNETRKILGDERIGVSATCARIPVQTGHSESVNVRTRRPLGADRARELLRLSPGVVVVDDPACGEYPTAIDAVGTDDVFVGRIRDDDSAEMTFNLWIVADNLRKGAATNAVQLAELALQRGLLG